MRAVAEINNTVLDAGNMIFSGNSIFTIVVCLYLKEPRLLSYLLLKKKFRKSLWALEYDASVKCIYRQRKNKCVYTHILIPSYIPEDTIRYFWLMKKES